MFAADLLVAQNIAFYVIAAVMVVGAVKVVTVKNMVHAALWLVIVFSGMAGMFILLAAEFIAITQVLVYIGAIVVLFLFGIMLTRAPMGRSTELDNGPQAKIVGGRDRRGACGGARLLAVGRLPRHRVRRLRGAAHI